MGVVGLTYMQDVVLTKNLWKRIQKYSHFKTASNSFWSKTWKRCGIAVPALLHPWL